MKLNNLIIGLHEFYGIQVNKFAVDLIIESLKNYDIGDINNAIMQMVKKYEKFPHNPVPIIINYIDPLINEDSFIADMYNRRRKGHAGCFTVLQKEFYKSLHRSWDQFGAINQVDLKFRAKEFLKDKRKSDDSEQDESQHRKIDSPDYNDEISGEGFKMLENLNIKKTIG